MQMLNYGFYYLLNSNNSALQMHMHLCPFEVKKFHLYYWHSPLCQYKFNKTELSESDSCTDKAGNNLRIERENKQIRTQQTRRLCTIKPERRSMNKSLYPSHSCCVPVQIWLSSFSLHKRCPRIASASVHLNFLLLLLLLFTK